MYNQNIGISFQSWYDVWFHILGCRSRKRFYEQVTLMYISIDFLFPYSPYNRVSEHSNDWLSTILERLLDSWFCLWLVWRCNYFVWTWPVVIGCMLFCCGGTSMTKLSGDNIPSSFFWWRWLFVQILRPLSFDVLQRLIWKTLWYCNFSKGIVLQQNIIF